MLYDYRKMMADPVLPRYSLFYQQSSKLLQHTGYASNSFKNSSLYIIYIYIIFTYLMLVSLIFSSPAPVVLNYKAQQLHIVQPIIHPLY
jgi:hypothetical protein